MSQVQQYAQAAIARLAGADRSLAEHVATGDQPTRAQKRAYIKANFPRHMRMELGFGRWRRHRYLSRRTG